MEPASRLMGNYRFGDLTAEIFPKVRLPEHPRTTFDEVRFLDLLKRTTILKAQEKIYVILGIAHLEQWRVERFMAIIEEHLKGASAETDEYGLEILRQHEEQAVADWAFVEGYFFNERRWLMADKPDGPDRPARPPRREDEGPDYKTEAKAQNEAQVPLNDVIGYAVASLVVGVVLGGFLMFLAR